MKLPRVVVATLALVIIGLGSKLALVQARAHSNESVLEIKIKMGDEHEFSCAISVLNAKRESCGGLARVEGVDLAYSISLVRQEGERVLLSVRSEYPPQFERLGPDEVKSMPETQQWFTPGETLPLKIAGTTKVVITGVWSDHMTSFFAQDDTLDPAAGELRVMSPVILQDGKLVQDFKGASAIADKPNMGIQVYWPGGGRFSISPVAIPGAVVAKVELNRISFVADGQSYEVITGMPVSRMGQVWVLHDAGYSPRETGWQIGTQMVSDMH